MNTTASSPMATTAGGADHDMANARAIVRTIRDADRRVRERFPMLEHQTAIGMGLVGLAYATAIVSGGLYIAGVLPAWACIVISAMAFSVLREIEHDMIHNLYFKGRRPLQNVVLFLIWPA